MMDIDKAFKKCMEDGKYHSTISGLKGVSKIYHLAEEEPLDIFTAGYKQARIDTLEDVKQWMIGEKWGDDPWKLVIDELSDLNKK